MNNIRYAIAKGIEEDYPQLQGKPQLKRFFDTTRRCYRTAVLIDVGYQERGRTIKSWATGREYGRAKSEAAPYVLDYLRQHPGSTRADIHRQFHTISHGTINMVIWRAKKDGLIRAEATGKDRLGRSGIERLWLIED